MRRKDCDISARTGRRAAGIIALMSGVACVCASATPACAQARAVRLWPKALVDEPAVRLGDVAQLAGFEEPGKTVLADFVVAEAPAPGQRLVVNHRELIAKLRAAGLNLAEVHVSGATTCEVSRPSAPSEPAGPIRDEPARAPAPPVFPAESGGRADRTLEDAVRSHIRAVLADYGGEVQISFNRSARLRSALSLARPRFAFRVYLDHPVPLGLVGLRVEVLENGRVVQTVPVAAEVALLRRVVVARRPINRGMTIAEKDVALAIRRFTDAEGIGATSLAPLIGQQARRFIDQGEMLAARDVQPVPLVKRGQLVTVYHRQSGIMIKTVGKALEGGSYGDVIPVKNESSRRSFDAMITGPQTVEVRAPGPGAADGVQT